MNSDLITDISICIHYIKNACKNCFRSLGITLINTVIEEIKFLNEGKKLNIIVENNQTTNINLVADKNRLSQVFLNLIGNSVKHAEGGNITVSITKKNKQQILIHIIGDGIGIPLHIQQKLFLKFVTGSKTGNGLGLFICKNIIERHGGKIWAKNTRKKVLHLVLLFL